MTTYHPEAQTAPPLRKPEPGKLDQTTRAQQLIEAGYYIAPANGYTLLHKDVDPRRTPYSADDAARGTHINIYHGLQRDGSYLAKIDLDSHKPSQDADAAKAAFCAALPHVARRIHWQRSTSGKGWWGWFLCNTRPPHGRIYDAAGRHLGELLSNDTAVSLDPGEIQPGKLNKTEYEHLTAYWTIGGKAEGSERWVERAAEGLRYIGGAYRYQYKQNDLVHFLRTYCKQINPKTGEILRDIGADYLRGDTLAPVENRSDRAGNLMQTILLFIRRAYPNAGFLELCQRSYMLWRTADSFGKALEKDYTAERDGASLLAQIIHGDPYEGGDRKWAIPFWAKAHPTPAPQPEPTPTPARPAHRPAGDQDKQIAKLKRTLERWQFDSADKIYYYVDDLAQLLKVERRAAQNYLHILEKEQKVIERGQDRGRGGRAWLILLPAFWGADNSEKPAETAPESLAFWGADTTPIERVQTPQSADHTPQCKGDHQNLCAPARPPGWVTVASGFDDSDQPMLGSYDPRYCYTPGPGWLDPSRPRLRPDAPATSTAAAHPRRLPRTRRRIKGQASFLAHGGEQVGKRYQRRAHVGEVPAPTPYRRPARMPEAVLPEPPAPGAPVGAHGSGDLPSAPAGAPPPAGSMFDRLRMLKAERQQVAS